MKKNDLYEAEIESVSYGGNAVAKIDGMAVFVPHGVAGDRALIRILKTSRSYAFGKIEKIVTPSADRTPHFCENAHKCGLCFGEFSYETELKYKKKFVEDAMRRIAGVDTPVDDVLPSPVYAGYRNKVFYPVSEKDGKVSIGFYRQRSHDVIDIDRCPLQHPVFAGLIPAVRDWMERYSVPAYDEKTCKGLIRHVGGRTAVRTGETVAVIVAARKIPREKELCDALYAAVPGLSGVVLNINKKAGNEILGDRFVTLRGNGRLSEFIGELRFDVSAPSFFQINPYQVERLYSKALELAAPEKDDVLLDLCSGAGTITLFFARHVKKAVGVEIVPEAVEDAKRNAENNGVKNAEFICADAGTAAKELLSEGFKPTLITLDPARRGLDAEAVSAAASFGAKKIVYVSCDPTTLARDLKLFCEKGYAVEKVSPVDMFPRTYHVETVVLMTKK